MVDLNTGGLTVATNMLFGAASLARSPVSGLLYYTEYNVTDGRVATWDPDTGVHTIIGSAGGGVPPIPRLGFRANDVLYATDDACELYTVNKANGSFTSVGTMTGVECDAGDLAFGADDQLYVLGGGTDDTLIWTVNLGTLVGTLVHDVQSEQGLAGIAFADAGAPYTLRTTLIHYSPTWVETTIGTFAVGLRIADAASSPIFADLSLAKIVDDATPDVGNNVVFTLTVTNAGPANATGVVVTDLLPSGYTYVSDDGGGDYDDATGIWTVGAVATGVPEVLNITATVLAAGVYDNGAEITAAGQFDSDSTPDNDVIAEDDQVLTTVTPNIPCPGAVVTNTGDAATGGSLRACIIWANGNAGVDTITVPAGTYTLTIAGTGEDAAATGDLDITDGIIINGDAATATIVDGNSLDRVFDIRPGIDMTATHLTIQRGFAQGTENGGGVIVETGGSLTLSDSTVSLNQTDDEGGGIYSDGTTTLTNVTLSTNTASQDGGGLHCQGTCNLTNTTVTLNASSVGLGDGLRVEAGGTVTFLNTIVANNPGDDCSGLATDLVSNGWNLSGDASCDFTSAGDQVNTDPLLGVLQDNGGPTFTHALGAGSLAIDGGTDMGCPAADQRAVARPIGGSCDIGAYEASAQAICPGAVVTNTIDAATGGSLRACILWANGNAGADTISFSIAGAGPHTIQPTSQFPIITDPVTIDGSTEPDFVTTPVVEIDGTFSGGARGFQINGGGAGTTIRALVINSFQRGIHINSAGNFIVGNWIGLDSDGITAAGNAAQGIFLTASGDNNTIGGTVDADRNVVSANGNRGIQVAGDNNVISHNFIGTDSTGAVNGVGNNSHGIRFNGDAEGNMVGGTTAADANVIADNNDGITHQSTGTANSFLRNSIYGNSGQGIDLNSDGDTANDAGDVDLGANNTLNWPVITAAAETAGTLNVDFDLDVIPAGNYRIEFFTNPSGADPSGFGQGEVYQDAVTIAHGGAGVESFSHSFAGSAGDIVTVTATLELGGPTYAATSEFGAAFTATLASNLNVVKRAFWPDGTPIATGVDIPSGVQFNFMLYVSNPGALVADVSIQDALDAAFGYVASSILYDNSVVNCSADPCTALEEAAIFTAVDSGTAGTDPVNADIVSFVGSTLDVGNQVQANAQLDILGNRVWAVMFTVTML